ncbi:hypothetical protein [Streptobacillus moniliformis]|uniref:hypothetical protein n=1 Tax=Streptobacillus moniliformis TaxID=34105 RepID=UPI0007E2E5F1|nr:hypothetical protein [Streptobacillus moniliformis]
MDLIAKLENIKGSIYVNDNHLIDFDSLYTEYYNKQFLELLELNILSKGQFIYNIINKYGYVVENGLIKVNIKDSQVKELKGLMVRNFR